MKQRTAQYLIIFGGAPGTGKTTVSRRLAAQLSIPRLDADIIGQTIKVSAASVGRSFNAQWMAYDVLFQLCEEFLQSGVSAILDVNLGWAFQWERLDAIRARHPTALVLPMLLRCSREICLERIRARHASDPAIYDAPERYTSDPAILSVWAFLDHLDRSDVYVVDAARGPDDVYSDIEEYLTRRWRIRIK